jgi:hypothetical protein
MSPTTCSTDDIVSSLAAFTLSEMARKNRKITKKTCKIPAGCSAGIKAGKVADLPLKITPYMLRVSAVTHLKGQGFVAGHASAEIVAAYDKSSQEHDITGQISLI